MNATFLRRIRLAAIGLVSGCLFAGAGSITRQFATGLGQNAISQVANVVLGAAIIDPLADALRPDEQ
jgi:hypothetical protein